MMICGFLRKTGTGLVLILLTACVKELSYNIDGAILPVVNCVLSNDTVQKLTLTQSVRIDEAYGFKEIRDAEITLWADEAIAGRFERTGYATWQLHYQPVIGQAYRLTVKLADGTELTATTTMPADNRIVPAWETDHYPARHFRQTTAENPCWIFVLSNRNGEIDTEHPSLSDKSLLRYALGTDHPSVDRFNEDETASDLVERISVPVSLRYIRTQPSDITGEGILFSVQTNYSGYDFVYFRTASAEYDQYLKSSCRKLIAYEDEDDPIQWFNEDRVYSNIENGLGIFAAYSDRFIYYHYNFFIYYDSTRIFPDIAFYD
ncbi:MAG: DUF4249 domain-containing protein [Dysgonamonadaceae bacterium]|jgi:hypothetical protein|nr:DUF4249 domain-containing protein [Dysgonamonadaceae bacterium]